MGILRCQDRPARRPCLLDPARHPSRVLQDHGQMIDRFGKRILVGYSETELVWLEAANSLPPYERFQALYDIADMSGRSIVNIREKACKLRQEAIDREWRRNRDVLVARRAVPHPCEPTAPSDFKWPSRAALMSGRAPSRRRVE